MAGLTVWSVVRLRLGVETVGGNIIYVNTCVACIRKLRMPAR